MQHRNEHPIRRTTMNPIRAFRNWRMYNETVRELNRLNARQLSDLGINRADIERIARQAI
ncbi:msl3766 [Mesorhizobium japonicum MAFF 303099]|uniref:Msl3766 protein n=7 Tax=Mesorhizobium TaxID=68287 RepID=Q98FI1_RHILO|nr:msl3766 [Mesorhizobium japonicum MAFF 303099]